MTRILIAALAVLAIASGGGFAGTASADVTIEGCPGGIFYNGSLWGLDSGGPAVYGDKWYQTDRNGDGYICSRDAASPNGHYSGQVAITDNLATDCSPNCTITPGVTGDGQAIKVDLDTGGLVGPPIEAAPAAGPTDACAAGFILVETDGVTSPDQWVLYRIADHNGDLLVCFRNAPAGDPEHGGSQCGDPGGNPCGMVSIWLDNRI